MDFISSYVKQSKLQFTYPDISNVEEIWLRFYGECELENSRIECARSFNREKQKIRNVCHLVYDFHKLIVEKCKNGGNRQPELSGKSVTEKSKDCLEPGMSVSDIVNSDCNVGCNFVNQNFDNGDRHVLPSQGAFQDTEKEAGNDVVKPEGGGARMGHVQKRHVERENGDDQFLKIEQAKLGITLRKNLLDICKLIPAYNPKIHVCRNSEVFESSIEKFNLTNSETNQLFHMWLPQHFFRQLALKKSSGNETFDCSNDNDIIRLKNLIFCTRNESDPNYEMLKELQIEQNESTFSFMSVFERLYRAVIPNVGLDGMIRLFIKKFNFLDNAACAVALNKKSLFECTTFIDFVRNRQSQSKQKLINSEKPTQKRVSFCEKPTVSPRSKYFCDKIYEIRRKFHRGG
ncbi:uncharacterized protein LOC142260682 [Anomaloglossus baeobatrachus]|uniref:uncharacterized protein LOC142260682 n=1 Tax=Anomaloglossus baeobatrachus TaxID=238106 RepID=UPI003F506359